MCILRPARDRHDVEYTHLKMVEINPSFVAPLSNSRLPTRGSADDNIIKRLWGIIGGDRPTQTVGKRLFSTHLTIQLNAQHLTPA